MKWPGKKSASDQDGSISSRESEVKEKKVKSKRPPNTPFRQQKLKAWTPILTSKTVLPLFFIVGVLFAPIGGLLLHASARTSEIKIDYSDCPRMAGDDWSPMPRSRLSSQFRNRASVPTPRWRREVNTTVRYFDSMVTVNDTSKCFLQFDIVEDLKPPVLFYYQLGNFYQNHRYYVKSFDALQLAGQARTKKEVETNDCDKLRFNKETNKPYYPCGYIANSIFNDTFLMPRLMDPYGTGSNDSNIFQMSKRGIAWKSEKNLYKKTMYKLGEADPPPHWVRRWDYTKRMPDFTRDESFQNWMRAAGLPTFSKLAMRNDRDIMKKGRYEIEIWDEYDTTKWNGTKSIFISTRTAMGGRNPFLGVSYVVVAILCILFGSLFMAASIVRPRKLGDDSYLSWNKEQPRRFKIPAKKEPANEPMEMTERTS